MQQPDTQTPAAKVPTLNEADAAEYLGISRSYLAAARLRKPRTSGPPYVRQGRRVTYLVTDLDAWLQRNRVTTAQASDTTNAPAA